MTEIYDKKTFFSIKKRRPRGARPPSEFLAANSRTEQVGLLEHKMRMFDWRKAGRNLECHKIHRATKENHSGQTPSFAAVSVPFLESKGGIHKSFARTSRRHADVEMLHISRGHNRRDVILGVDAHSVRRHHGMGHIKKNSCAGAFLHYQIDEFRLS